MQDLASVLVRSFSSLVLLPCFYFTVKHFLLSENFFRRFFVKLNRIHSLQLSTYMSCSTYFDCHFPLYNEQSTNLWRKQCKSSWRDKNNTLPKHFPLNLSPNKLISHSEKAVEVTLEYHATSQTLLRRLSLRTSGNWTCLSKLNLSPWV